MKKVLSLLIITSLSFSINAQGIKWRKNVKKVTFAQVKALAKKENKKIFLDFYTKWCGPCRTMDAEVFSKKAIGDFYNEKFINFKIDAEVGEGVELAKRYEVKGYPTYVFADVEGTPLIEAGSHIGRSDVKGMLTYAKEALGAKVKTWEQFQAEYKASDKKDPVFLQAYMDARMKFIHRYPSDTLLLEWVKALPKDSLFKNKRSKGTIKWQSIPGNEFYKMLLANKKEYPELSNDKTAAIVFMSGTLLRGKLGGDYNIDYDKTEAAFLKDFPKYAKKAIQYTKIDHLRFNPEKLGEFVDKYFDFIDKEELPIDMCRFISSILTSTPNLKPKHALRVLHLLDKGVNSNPPHFYSIAAKTYLLAKGGKKTEAKILTKKFKKLTESFKGNKKMEWMYNVMKSVEAGEMPKNNKY